MYNMCIWLDWKSLGRSDDDDDDDDVDLVHPCLTLQGERRYVSMSREM